MLWQLVHRRSMSIATELRHRIDGVLEAVYILVGLLRILLLSENSLDSTGDVGVNRFSHLFSNCYSQSARALERQSTYVVPSSPSTGARF